jgi:hypothetical protein
MSPYRGYFEGGSSPPHGGSDNEQENESDDVQVGHEGETDKSTPLEADTPLKLTPRLTHRHYPHYRLYL